MIWLAALNESADEAASALRESRSCLVILKLRTAMRLVVSARACLYGKGQHELNLRGKATLIFGNFPFKAQRKGDKTGGNVGNSTHCQRSRCRLASLVW
jgi:hypothetical protein